MNKMSARRREKPHNVFLQARNICLILFFVFLASAPRVLGQGQIAGTTQTASPPQGNAYSGTIISLEDLLTEAEQNNPQIQAVRHG